MGNPNMGAFSITLRSIFKAVLVEKKNSYAGAFIHKNVTSIKNHRDN